MRTVIMGSGNVASLMSRKLHLAGHNIIQVFGRSEIAVKTLALETGAAAISKSSELDTTAELYVIAVSDQAIESIAGWLRVPGKLVMHTAGSVSISVLAPCSQNHGVIYPLQSITKETTTVTEIPVLVNGSNDETKSELFAIAAGISANVQFADDEQRSKLHLAAVIMNNFPNYLYTLTAEFCQNEQLDFKMLIPLLIETSARLKSFSPRDVQTGPAIRKDLQTINAHEKKLKNYDDLLELYSTFSRKIMNYPYLFFFFFLPTFMSVS